MNRKDRIARIQSPHDALFRLVAAHPQSLSTLLHEHAPPDLVVNLDGVPTLIEATHIDGDTLGRTESDGLVKAFLKYGLPKLAYLLLEHKSDPDPRVMLKIIKRMVNIWENYAEGDARRMKELPVIYVILFYHGAKPWNPEDMLEVAAGEGDDWLGLKVRIIFVDLTKLPPDRLSADPFAQAAFHAMLYASGHLKGNDALVATLRQIPDDEHFSNPLTSYILDIEEPSKVAAAFRIANPLNGETMMRTAGEQLRAEGRVEGRAELLIGLLQHRFGALPPGVLSQVTQASTEDLEAWSLRMLDAESLDSVFETSTKH